MNRPPLVEQATREAWIENLEFAQELLRDAYWLIHLYCQHSGDVNTGAYIADPLRILIDGAHGFISRDKNLDDVIRDLRHPEED